jgi:hypothetical protein
VQSARELAEADWTPCQGTVDVVGRLADYEAKTVSLNQALSIAAFGSFVDPPERDEVEVVAFKHQAASALCHAAFMGDVGMYGSHLSADRKVQPIFEMAFGLLRWDGDLPNSLVRDHESSAPSNKGVQSWEGDWLNVEVDVVSLVGWLQTSVEAERKKELRSKQSRRLFEYPFWSIDTALCWIAIRDAGRLKENLLWLRRRRRPDKNFESQPEIRLLRTLKDGTLKAQNDRHVLPRSHWANSVATMGDLSAATPSLRIAREDVLRVFPETPTLSYGGVRARRQASIDRVVGRMQATRRWIGCAEIADRSTRHLAKPTSGRSAIIDRLEKSFNLGEFLSARKSQLCLLRADTAGIRLMCAPVDRTVDAEGFRPGSVSVSHFLEDCWLPNEMCRAWFKQQKLDWPLHFETTLREAGRSPKTEPPLAQKLQGRVGRPSKIQHYVKELERVLQEEALEHMLRQQANKLEAWGLKNLEKNQQAKVDTLENYIRERVKKWAGDVHGNK